MDLNKEQQKLIDKLTAAREEKMKNAGKQGRGFGKVDRAIELTRQQPDSIKETLEKCRQDVREYACELVKRGTREIIAVGCGDSYFAALTMQMAVEYITNLRFMPFQALEYSRYYNRLTSSESALLAISSSGVVPRTVEAMLVGHNRGALTAAITNNYESPMAENADYVINVAARREGPPTQSSTAAMAVILAIAVEVARASGRAEIAERVWKEITELPEKVEKSILSCDEIVKGLAADLKEKEHFHFIGGGPGWGAAHFGYAKIREATWDESMPWELEEWDHEQTGQIPEGLPVFLIAPEGESYDRSIEIARVLKKDKAYLVSIVKEGEKEIKGLSNVSIEIPEVPEYISPFLFSVPLQLFALYLAKEKF